MAGLLLIGLAAVLSSTNAVPTLKPVPWGGVLERFRLAAKIQPRQPTTPGFIIEPRTPPGPVIEPRTPGSVIQPREPVFNIKPNNTLVLNSRPLNYKPRAEKELKCEKKTQKATLKDGDSLTFYSKNYPNNYDKKTMCKWQIKGKTQDTWIYIWCEAFTLEAKNKKGKCKGDYLDINRNKFCGNESPVFISETKNVKMKFKTNKSKQYSGFRCQAWAHEWKSTTVAPPVTTTEEPPVPPTVSPTTCVCGKANRGARIVNGVTTEVNEYPWQVALVSRGGSSVFCGGSLINNRWVLTAAHCTQSGVAEVLLGNHLQSQVDSAERRVSVRRVVDHPNYNPRNLDNDFSLLELATPLNLANVAPEIRPVCLPTASNPAQWEGVPSVVSGWGTTTSGGSAPNALRETVVKTMSNSACNGFYGSGTILSSMICASNSNPQRDACQGDSGGPLVRNAGGYFNLIGVVSWGYGCADPQYPGVYSRVTDAINWITTTSSSGGTCSPP